MNEDNKKLYKDLQAAIKEDQLYWVRNDAKIRACTTTQNYDEFRNIVDAAHLKGLTKEDYKKKYEKSWNSVLNKN